MTAVDTAAAAVLTRTLAFTAAVDAYRAFRADIDEVRTAGISVKVALANVDTTLGDVDDNDAYLDALDRARRAVRTADRLTDLDDAGHPDR